MAKNEDTGAFMDPQMCMVIDERTLGMWYIGSNPKSYNYLTHLAKLKEGEYLATWRIRVYKNNEIFDSEDTFRWHQHLLTVPTDEQAVDKSRFLWRTACQHASSTESAWELVRGDLCLADFQTQLLKMPDMHPDPNPAWHPGMPCGVR